VAPGIRIFLETLVDRRRSTFFLRELSMTPVASRKSLLVVGGGPVGIEMALAALRDGSWHVTIAERGDRPAANLATWAHVRLFSAWSLNVSAAGLDVLDAMGVPRPASADIPTGDAFARAYLLPIWRYLGANERCSLRLSTTVISIARGSLLKLDMGSDRRRQQRFRVLVTSTSGAEEIIECDAVVDASGTYGNANWLGVGGIPALGERQLRSRIMVGIPNVLGADRSHFTGSKVTALIGCGYSAITTLNLLKMLAEEEAPEHPDGSVRARVVWATRREGGGQPYQLIPNDPLPDRDALSQLGNAYAAGKVNSPALEVKYLGGVQLSQISESAAGMKLTFVSADGGSPPISPDFAHARAQVAACARTHARSIV
jgi:hypothetical protein